MTNLVPRNAPDCDGKVQQRLSVSAVFPSVDWYLLRKHNDRALFERYLLFVGTGGTFTTCILCGYCIAFQATATKIILLLCSTEHSSDCNYWTITGKQWCEIFEITVPQWMKITSKFRQIGSKLRQNYVVVFVITGALFSLPIPRLLTTFRNNVDSLKSGGIYMAKLTESSLVRIKLLSPGAPFTNVVKF